MHQSASPLSTPRDPGVGRSWAEIARFVGQRKLSITADTYTHVLVDGREVDLLDLLAQAQTESPQPTNVDAALAMIDTSATRA